MYALRLGNRCLAYPVSFVPDSILNPLKSSSGISFNLIDVHSSNSGLAVSIHLLPSRSGGHPTRGFGSPGRARRGTRTNAQNVLANARNGRRGTGYAATVSQNPFWRVGRGYRRTCPVSRPDNGKNGGRTRWNGSGNSDVGVIHGADDGSTPAGSGVTMLLLFLFPFVRANYVVIAVYRARDRRRPPRAVLICIIVFVAPHEICVPPADRDYIVVEISRLYTCRGAAPGCYLA